MEISQLRAFLMIAREGHMTRAASQLHLTQPAVSAQLAKLEEELGQRLFDRTPTGMVLTEAGVSFRTYVEEALARLEDGRVALDQLIGLQRGSLSVGGGATATTYLLPPILGRFHEENPGIRFFVREQSSQQSVVDVLSGELDLGIVTLPVKTPTETRTPSGKLEVEPWVEDELRLIVPPDHPLDAHKSFEWIDLDGQPLVLFEAGSAVRAIIDRRIDETQIGVDIVMELRAIESIKQMVAQGIGAGFVSQFALARPEKGLRCVEQPIRRRLAVIYRSDRTQSPATRAFLEMMRQ
jgi:DNA-binding transcriptional LysR family regulator